MATKTLITPMDGTPEQIVFADHATDFSPTAANDLRVTTDGSNELDVQLDLTSLADGAARQSAKFDLGSKWAEKYLMRAAFEMAATPTAGNSIGLYFGWSQASAAATANTAALTGSDAAYSGYSSNLAASVKQLDGPYLFTCTAQATGTIQVGVIGILYPPSRYGIVVVKNDSNAAFHSDAVESHIVLDPIVREFQDA
jgi:hypothetical protein